MLVVPRGEDFCVDARLRRVCLLDSPPGPLSFDEKLRLEPNLDLLQLMQDGAYLYRVYRSGTPLEELDVDLIGGLRTRPSSAAGDRVLGARLGPLVVEAIVASPHSTPGDSKGERELQALPRALAGHAPRRVRAGGVPLAARARRPARREPPPQTCFAFDQDGRATVSSSDASVSPLVRVPIDLGDLDIGGVDNLDATRSTSDAGVPDGDPLERARAATGGPARAAAQAPEGSSRDRRPERLARPLDRLAKLRPDDDRNLDFDEAADLLQLSKTQRARLQKAGATDLRTIGQALSETRSSGSTTTPAGSAGAGRRKGARRLPRRSPRCLRRTAQRSSGRSDAARAGGGRGPEDGAQAA